MRQTLLAALLCNHGRRAGTNSTGITAGGSASRAKSDVQEPGRRQETRRRGAHEFHEEMSDRRYRVVQHRCGGQEAGRCRQVEFHQEVPRGRGRHLNDLRVAAGRGAGAQCPRYG
jgi:hypothetical protein